MRLVGAALLACLTSSAGAQAVVRGRITGPDHATPIIGAVVSLERATGDALTDQTRYSTLSSDSGSYSLIVPGPGSYRVTAKRIGVKRAESATFTIATGETKIVDLSMEIVVQTLPQVLVRDVNICTKRPEDRDQVASLWDEASTLLTATRIAARESLNRASLVTYTRTLDARTLRVKSGTKRQMDSAVDRPIRSLSGDSLSAIGYWHQIDQDTTVFYGLDAQAITSLAFRRDHCFHVAEKDPDHPGMVGLAFEPAPNRTKPDVIGTLWLDSRTFELRSVSFEYTQLESDRGVDHLGGEVFFARFGNGVWLVRRWYLRMPQYIRKTLNDRGVEPLPFPHLVAVVEEGGQVTAAGLTTFERPAVITGTVLDSLGATVPNGTVRLAGTPYSTRTDAEGRFRLDSLPPGAFDLRYEDPGYAGYGIAADEADVSLGEGASLKVDLRADRVADLAARMCDGKKPQGQQAVMRVALTDSLTGRPLGGWKLRVSWQEYGQAVKGFPTVHNPVVLGRTDGSGVAMFCALPSRKELELSRPLDADHAQQLASFKLKDGELLSRTVRVQR